MAKNMMATLLLAIGTPMMLGGDEFGRTQGGNNNAYCQNNEISWYDWAKAERNSSFTEFVSKLVAFRLAHPAFRRPEFFTGKDANFNALPDIAWFSPDGSLPDWARLDGAIAARLDGSHADIIADRDDNDFFIMINASPHDQSFTVAKAPPNRHWYRVMDTALAGPDDFLPHGALNLYSGIIRCGRAASRCSSVAKHSATLILARRVKFR
jgi:isoamylase